MEGGGILLRFAGSRLAGAGDDLEPVALRRGGRTFGGSLSWDKPKPLAAFDKASPFYGLTPTADVTVTRQVLAEPDAGLAGRTWAQLDDGTPLVTAQKRGPVPSCCSTSRPTRPGPTSPCRDSSSTCCAASSRSAARAPRQRVAKARRPARARPSGFAADPQPGRFRLPRRTARQRQANPGRASRAWERAIIRPASTDLPMRLSPSTPWRPTAPWSGPASMD